jgi:two-component system, NarL family, response regulator YdfI
MANIVICAENPITRAGLAAMAITSSNQVIAQLSNLLALSTWLQTQSADLVVMELSKVGESELNEIIQITDDLSHNPAGDEGTMPVLLMLGNVLSDVLENGHELGEKRFRQLMAEMLSTGLVSILPIAVSAHQLRDAIAAILNGLTILHPDMTETIFTGSDSAFTSLKSSSDNLPEPLTAREIQVLNQLANGLTNRAIAKAFHISEHTVKFHVSAIFLKLGVSSRTEAVATGVRTGLVML